MGLIFTIFILLLCAFVWLLPILIIASSNEASGFEKTAWIIAVIFVSWFAWILYWLLAPLGRERRVY